LPKIKEKKESAPRTNDGADANKKKKPKRAHHHVGPYARAYRAGLAMCPSCDAEKIVRITERERFEYEKTIRDMKASKR